MKKVLLFFLLFNSIILPQTDEEILKKADILLSTLREKQNIFDEELRKLKLNSNLFANKNEFETDQDYFLRRQTANIKSDSLYKAIAGSAEKEYKILLSQEFIKPGIEIQLNQYDAEHQIYYITLTNPLYRNRLWFNISKDDARKLHDNWDKVAKKGIFRISNLGELNYFDDGIGKIWHDYYSSNKISEAPVKTGYVDKNFKCKGGHKLLLAKILIDSIEVQLNSMERGIKDDINPSNTDPLEKVKITNNGRFIAGITDNIFFIRDIQNPEKIFSTSHRSISDIKRLLTIPQDKYRPKEEKILNEVNMEDNIDIQISPDSKKLALITYLPDRDFVKDRGYCYIYVFNLDDPDLFNSHATPKGKGKENSNLLGNPVKTLSKKPEAVSFSNDGEFLIFKYEDNVSVFSLLTQNLPFTEKPDFLKEINNSNYDIVVDYDKISVQRPADKKTIRSIEFNSEIASLIESKDHSVLAVGINKEDENSVKIYSIPFLNLLDEIILDGEVRDVSLDINDGMVPDEKIRDLSISPFSNYVIVNGKIYFIRNSKPKDSFTAELGFQNERDKETSLKPEEQGKFTLTLKNNGKETVKNININIKPAKLENVNYKDTWQIKSIDAGQSETVTIPIVTSFDKKPAEEEFTFNIENYTGVLTEPVKCKVNFLAYPKPNLIAAAEYKGQDGQSNYMEALSTGNITVKVKNTGEGTAKSVKVVLYPKNQVERLIEWGDPLQLGIFIGDIKANEEVSQKIPMKILPGVRNNEQYEFEISLIESKGFNPKPIPLNITAKAYQKPYAELESFEVEKETKSFIFKFRNLGLTPITDCKVKFSWVYKNGDTDDESEKIEDLTYYNSVSVKFEDIEFTRQVTSMKIELLSDDYTQSFDLNSIKKDNITVR